MGLWFGATSKGDLRCKAGNSRSMPCGAISGGSCHVSEGQEWRKQAVPPQRNSNSTFLQERRGWHVAFPQSGSYDAMWQENMNGGSKMRHLRGGFFYFFWCREVWTCGRQVSAVWRSLLKWRHLRGEFEFQMEVGSGGMKDGHVAFPQNGSYDAMWQLGKARNMWRHLGQVEKGRTPGFSPPSSCLKIFEWLLFWWKPRVTCVLYFFWRR